MKNPRILVVDDEEDILIFFKRYFGKRGYEISTAIDAAISLRKIKQSEFDMIVTNINMPGMNGLDMLREINKLKKDVIKIITTGSHDLKHIKQAIKLDCFAYITKPLNLGQLENIIRKAFITSVMPNTILLAVD